MPAIPAISAFVDPGVTEGDFKTALNDLHAYLTGLLGSAGTQAGAQAALGALFGGGRVVRSTAYTITAADRGKVISCTGTWTLSLTAAGTLGNGFACVIANVGSGTITIDPAGSETIGGDATKTVRPGATAVIAVDGSAWVAIDAAQAEALAEDIAAGVEGAPKIRTVAMQPPAAGSTTIFRLSGTAEIARPTNASAYLDAGLPARHDPAAHWGVHVLVAGTLTVYGQHRAPSSGTAYLRVLKNGTQVQEWSTSSSSWQMRSVDITVDVGDTIVFQQRNSLTAASPSWRNLEVRSATPDMAVA